MKFKLTNVFSFPSTNRLPGKGERYVIGDNQSDAEYKQDDMTAEDLEVNSESKLTSEAEPDLASREESESEPETKNLDSVNKPESGSVQKQPVFGVGIGKGGVRSIGKGCGKDISVSNHSDSDSDSGSESEPETKKRFREESE